MGAKKGEFPPPPPPPSPFKTRTKVKQSRYSLLYSEITYLIYNSKYINIIYINTRLLCLVAAMCPYLRGNAGPFVIA